MRLRRCLINYSTLFNLQYLKKKAVRFTAPTLVNNLSINNRLVVTFDSLESLLKTELFGIAFPDVSP